jgi:hypothetical protein
VPEGERQVELVKQGAGVRGFRPRDIRAYTDPQAQTQEDKAVHNAGDREGEPSPPQFSWVSQFHGASHCQSR